MSTGSHTRHPTPDHLKLSLHLPRLVGLQHVFFLHVRIVLEDDAALEACLDLADVVLEPLQREIGRASCRERV